MIGKVKDRQLELFISGNIEDFIPAGRKDHAPAGRWYNEQIFMNMVNKEIWCVVGNVKKEIPYGPGGKEIKSGLKKFKAGAKLHIIGAYYGMAENIVAIGQHRKNRRFISCTIRVDTVENFRVKKIYSKRILELLEDGMNHSAGGCGFETKEDAEKFMNTISTW